MPILSDYAQKKKIEFFLSPIPQDARILEIGSGTGWVGKYLRENQHAGYVGLDLVEPADIVGDIRNWRALGLEPESFDVIIAFEVVEHVNCFAECYDLLRSDGIMLVTTPVPHLDWIERILEWLRLSQKRTSPHDHLVRLESVDYFDGSIVRFGFLDQWGILKKSAQTERLH